jgi:DNA-binding protein HU-beta
MLGEKMRKNKENLAYFTRFSLYTKGGKRLKWHPMNKAELVEAVQNALGGETSKRAAQEAVDAVLDSIAKGVKKDKVVQLIGFGTFKVSKRAARKGRNPKTGETIKIAASKSVRFSPSSTLKASL